jgi:hypothetical protein
MAAMPYRAYEKRFHDSEVCSAGRISETLPGNTHGTVL